MGAWDYEIFDNDAALDFVADIEGAEDPKSLFKEVIEQAQEADYLESDEGSAVLVVAACVDHIINGTDYGDETVGIIKKKHPNMNITDLKPGILRALEIVLSDKSELNELWMENEELYPKWKQTVEDIMKRLQ